jgi:hypothetical protein
MQWKLLLVALAAALPVWAAPDPSQVLLWRLGTFDGSSDEFAARAREQHAPFVIGRSSIAADWPSFQPLARPGLDPQAVAFQLPGAPDPNAIYRLHLAVLFETACIPALQVGINGHHGRFYFQPKIDNRMGDAVGGNRTGYSCGDLTFDFPGAYLLAGTNEITFQPFATSPQTVPDAGLTYDAIELTREAGIFDSARATVELVPTVFYRSGKAGLEERIDATVRYGHRPQQAEVHLQVGQAGADTALRGDLDFGEERLALYVPEFAGPLTAEATLTDGGRQTKFSRTLKPGKKWTVFVVPEIHLDIGYTDVQAKVGTLQARVLDQAMDLADQNPGFNYTTDGSWCVEEFMRSRGVADQQRLIQAIKDKKIFVPANYCSLLTGFPSAETLIRSLYYSANFSRRYGTPLNYATMTDAPSYTWSYASVLAAAGIHDFLGGSNNDRGPILLKGDLRERSPMNWVGPDGHSVLFWYARVYRQVQMLFGLPPIVDAGTEMLPVFLQTYESPLYHADAVILYGTQGENRELYPEQAQLVAHWNASFAYPKLQYSGVKDAIDFIARQSGENVRPVRGDGGPYWEDDIPANPIHTAMERNSEARAQSAEKFATLAALANPALAADPLELTEMWDEMVLYDEHNCLMPDAPKERDTLKGDDMLQVKNAHAIRADQLSRKILQSSLAQLADSIEANRGSLIVFNSLSWPRSGEVTWDLSDGDQVVDSVTGHPVAAETLTRGHHFSRIRFLATEVPAVGYKVYMLRHTARREGELAKNDNLAIEDMLADERGASNRPVAHASSRPTGSAAAALGTRMENVFYRVELDPESGSIRSIYDKQLQQELVDVSTPYRFGQYIYVTGGDMPLGKLNGLLQYAKPPPVLSVHGAEKGKIVSLRRMPLGWKAQLVSSAVNTRQIATEIRLYDHQKKIELVEDVKKDEVYRREGIYFAFPCKRAHPQFQYEIQNGVIDPAKDMLPGAGLDWFSAQHWASVQQDGVAGSVLTLDAPLLSFGDVIRGTWSSNFAGRPGSIFSNVVNNYHVPRALIDLPAPVVEDSLHFRYVITSAASTDPVALSRLGWEETTPLEIDEVQPQDQSWIRPRPLNGKQGTFLQVADARLLLMAWKPAEDGRGTILRFLDLGGSKRRVSVGIPILNLETVQLTDAIERDLPSASLNHDQHQFELEVGRNEIISVRIVGASALKRVPAKFTESLGR